MKWKKKKRYQDSIQELSPIFPRVILVEHGSFTPIAFSALGGCGVETSRFISKLVEKVAMKKDMETSIVANYIRSKVSFELIRSQIACIRGSRSLRKISIDTNEVEMVDCASRIKEDWRRRRANLWDGGSNWLHQWMYMIHHTGPEIAHNGHPVYNGFDAKPLHWLLWFTTSFFISLGRNDREKHSNVSKFSAISHYVS